MLLLPADVLAGAPAGGKARALAVLAGAGVPVPPWVVVAPQAFRCAVGASGVENPETAAALATPSTEITTALDAAFLSICGARGLAAVRSSAADEDGPAHSFAGQLESVLRVPRDQLPAAVAAVWRSGFSPRITEYRRQHGLSLPPPPPAVIVQRMVAARVAGVAFSADPVSGRRAIAVVSAAPGLGDTLVSGQADADLWHVARDGAVVIREVAPGRDRPALTDDEAREVAALARRSAALFGTPQDIEWAYDADRLWLLQSRPITSIARLADPDGTLRLWDNSNIVESYSGVTTPLTFSFASEVYEHVYRQFCRIMRVPERRVQAHAEAFRNMLGLVRGRIYYNLLNWYRVLALLPGFAVNRRFMEQMMGVREGLPDSVAREIEARGRGARLADALHLAGTAAGLVLQHVTIDRRVRAFTARLDAALAAPSPPLADRNPDELVAHYGDLRAKLLLSWDAPLVNDFFAMIFYGLLRSLSRTWCADVEGTLQNDLVGGQGGLVSAEPAHRLTRLAALAAADAGLMGRLEAGTAAEIQEAIGGNPTFAREFAAYLERFGERSVNELKLETATFVDDPLPLLRAVGRMASNLAAGRGPVQAGGAQLREAARHRIAGHLRSHPVRRLVFHWVLRHARARVRDRENLRLERTRLFGRVRRIFLELGARLAALGVLREPRDVFYLTVDEVLAYVEGRATTTSLNALVATRRSEFDQYQQMAAPDDRFETRGVVYHAHTYTRALAAEPTAVEGPVRKGLGCCPGIVRGPVCVVRDPRTVSLARPSVLVAEHTDPGWITIFPSAIAVLVERGSLLSHAAIVARELGIPGVIALPGLTAWLQDGDWVEVDGSAGTVRTIVPPPDEGDRTSAEAAGAQ